MIRKVGQVAAFTATLMPFTGSTVVTASAVVSKIVDGDTITLNSGENVRLLQIDTPELASSECYGVAARAALASLLNTKAVITLKDDPTLDKVDRYGRSLRYIFVGKTNINLKMVEIGAAAPYFYRGEKGLYSAQFLKAAEKAKGSKRGLWKACPGTRLTPTTAITTSAVASTGSQGVTSNNANCDPNYAGCIPVFPSDVDCLDIKRLGLAPVKVIGSDIHRLDRDGDGIGCDK
jgi:endonuclease YncB( thermonuclease family)